MILNDAEKYEESLLEVIKHWYNNIGFSNVRWPVANVQFATGSRTFAPKRNNLGAKLLVQR